MERFEILTQFIDNVIATENKNLNWMVCGSVALALDNQMLGRDIGDIDILINDKKKTLDFFNIPNKYLDVAEDIDGDIDDDGSGDVATTYNIKYLGLKFKVELFSTNESEFNLYANSGKSKLFNHRIRYQSPEFVIAHKFKYAQRLKKSNPNKSNKHVSDIINILNK